MSLKKRCYSLEGCVELIEVEIKFFEALNTTKYFFFPSQSETFEISEVKHTVASPLDLLTSCKFM